MPRKPEIGNVQLYPNRPLNKRDKNGYVLKFYCPIRQARIRKNCGTRDRREARKILRECRERLLNGKYMESGGAITDGTEDVRVQLARLMPSAEPASKTWSECVEAYRSKHAKRTREKSHKDAMSRIEIAGRILEGRRQDLGLVLGGMIEEFSSLDSMEYLQDRLLAGDEGKYDYRAATTVNSTVGAVLAFLRFCKKHRWISELPPIDDLSVDEVMKGRPITVDEFQQMLDATARVVGDRPKDSWKRVLNVLWESAFRVGDVMDFSWDQRQHIHPVWPEYDTQHPTITIPSTQKNGKHQVIPMLPELGRLLEVTPSDQQVGWIVDPQPMQYEIKSDQEWFQPTEDDLRQLVGQYNNSAIARACQVTETTVRRWLVRAGIMRDVEFDRHRGELTDDTVASLRERATLRDTVDAQRACRRLTKERVSRIIGLIGQTAGIVVQEAIGDRRAKFASAHDLRRGCAKRLIDLGVSAETLKVVLRHKDFATTEKFYGATRSAQAAASEIHNLGQASESRQFSEDEMSKLRTLLNSL